MKVEVELVTEVRRRSWLSWHEVGRRLSWPCVSGHRRGFLECGNGSRQQWTMGGPIENIGRRES